MVTLYQTAIRLQNITVTLSCLQAHLVVNTNTSQQLLIVKQLFKHSGNYKHNAFLCTLLFFCGSQLSHKKTLFTRKHVVNRSSRQLKRRYELKLGVSKTQKFGCLWFPLFFGKRWKKRRISKNYSITHHSTAVLTVKWFIKAWGDSCSNSQIRDIHRMPTLRIYIT